MESNAELLRYALALLLIAGFCIVTQVHNVTLYRNFYKVPRSRTTNTTTVKLYGPLINVAVKNVKILKIISKINANIIQNF